MTVPLLPLVTDERINALADEAWRQFSAGMAWNTQDCTLHIRNTIRQAVREAGEECAGVCDRVFADARPESYDAQECAELIRRRL